MSVPSTESLLEVASEIAREAGALLRERFERGTERALASKSTPTDLVSEADLASERRIRELLDERRPDDGILGEEQGQQRAGTTGLRWVVDPLDGTINFLFGIPQWCVSIAVEDERGTLAGAVYAPMLEELFSASREHESRLGGHPIRGSERADLETALVATGFAYDARVRAAQAPVVAGLMTRVRDIRRMGSAALDLAWTAAGRYDAYFERSVKPWDIAAGALICERAGLELLDLPEGPDLPYGILAAPAGLAGELLGLVKGAAD